MKEQFSSKKVEKSLSKEELSLEEREERITEDFEKNMRALRLLL